MHHHLVQGHRSHHASRHPQAACHGHPSPAAGSPRLQPARPPLREQGAPARDRGVRRPPAGLDPLLPPSVAVVLRAAQVEAGDKPMR